MEMRPLGTNGPQLSVVGYGAWEAGGDEWGPNESDERVVAAIRTALDSGMNWIDTAEVYGGGTSERLVAQVLAAHPDVMVFTKVAPAPAGTGFRADEVRAAATGSLERLGRDCIDLYQLHWPDPRVDVEETWEAMAGLVEEGLIGCAGVSNFGRELIERCERIRHVDSLQPEFSMLHRDGRDDLFIHCEQAGTGVIAYGPLAYGLLTGAIDASTEFSNDDWRSGKHGMGSYEELFAPPVIGRHLEVVDRLRPIAEELGITLPKLGLAWVFHQRGVAGAIAGSRSPEHTRENAEAGDVELSGEVLERIEQVL